MGMAWRQRWCVRERRESEGQVFLFWPSGLRVRTLDRHSRIESRGSIPKRARLDALDMLWFVRHHTDGGRTKPCSADVIQTQRTLQHTVEYLRHLHIYLSRHRYDVHNILVTRVIYIVLLSHHASSSPTKTCGKISRCKTATFFVFSKRETKKTE
jgi:hypothetical protein